MITAAVFALAAFQAPKLDIGVKFSAIKPSEVSGSVTVKIPDGWHGYQNPPKSEFENPIKLSSKTKGFKLTKVTYPKGVEAKSSGMDSLIYEGTIKIDFVGTVDKTLKPGKKGYEAQLEVFYQLCDASTCIPPSTAAIKIGWTSKK